MNRTPLSVRRRNHALYLGALLVMLMLLGIDTMAATGSSAPGEPSFYIESISVEGLVRASSAILISESTLSTGREYSEDQLRQAVYRINRLPFVIEARFSLRKGSERGRYELVITVEETERFFFGLEGGSQYAGSFDSDNASLTIGARQFIGAGGMLYGSVQPTYMSIYEDDELDAVYSLGYTQYNLLGRPISLSLGLSYSPRWQTKEASFGLGLQLPHNQSLRAVWGASEESRTWACFGLLDEPLQRCEVTTRSNQLTVVWRYDTTDDLLFPTRGLLVSALASAVEAKTSTETVYGTLPAVRTTSRSLQLIGEQSYSLTARQVLTARASLGANRYRRSTDSFAGENEQWFGYYNLNWWDLRAGAEYGFDLLRTSPRGPARDLRWLSSVDLGVNDLSDEHVTTLSLGTGLAFRNRWGVIRLTLSYDEELGGR